MDFKKYINEYSFALTFGLLISIAVILSNIVFPNNKSDDEQPMYLVFLCLFALFFIGGVIGSRKTNSLKKVVLLDNLRTDNYVIGSRKTNSLKKGAYGGAITALIIIGMTMLTFFIIDNLFLDIVSKQPDKIWDFSHQTTYNDMQSFINHQKLKGLIFVLPVITVIGAILGTAGAFVRRFILHRT